MKISRKILETYADHPLKTIALVQFDRLQDSQERLAAFRKKSKEITNMRQKDLEAVKNKLFLAERRERDAFLEIEKLKREIAEARSKGYI